MTAKHGYPILAFVQFVTEFCCSTPFFNWGGERS